MGASVAMTVLSLAQLMPLAEHPITFEGIGPVRVGSSLAAAYRAAGEQLVDARAPCRVRFHKVKDY